MSALLTGDLNALLRAPHESAAVIRSLLRHAAADVTRRCDPADLAAAYDSCTLHLQNGRTLPEHPDVFVSGSITLGLSAEDREAVRQLLARRRARGIDDTVEAQRAEHLRRILSDPATAVPWWLDPQTKALNAAPSADQLKTVLTSLAEATSTIHKLTPLPDVPVEYQLLELLRSFVTSFPQDHQKRMLMTLMALGFDKAGRPNMAASIEQLMEARYPAPASAVSNPSTHSHDDRDLGRGSDKNGQSNGRLLK
ncbi:hypothetical protein [Nonomuraea angiospora]|uniref:hypothetical protein n=1 Tax=Nonomuraea angiospora TaxID=46172 RepID=UPI0029A89363|nr:hypothetical protein [Nonomuraea angiospora]MDX3108780.1 hypothetical protein [Nonomuraea angiospora]